MPRPCRHQPRESLRGTGECEIVAKTKNRNGKPRHWCETHGQAAWRPDGTAMERCEAAFFAPIDDSDILELDCAEGAEIGLWGALAPAIAIGDIDREPAGVHVHHRLAGEPKDIDGTYQIVRLHHGDQEVLIEGSASIAFSVSQMLNRPLVVLRCPKEECGAVHLDELQFATFPHRKHQCNRCGRSFHDTHGPSTSNPLADAHRHLGLPDRQSPKSLYRPLRLRSEDYGGIAIWPTNAAIVWTAARPEDEGLHVHAWDDYGDLVIDETFSTVVLDGHALDEDSLKLLCAQRELVEHPDQITTLACGHCHAALTTRPDGGKAFTPRTDHECDACGEVTRTSRRRFLHPLADRPQPLA